MLNKPQARNVGFGSRIFLTESEWLTYLKRMPVRYISDARNPVCAVCGLPGTKENPLTHGHIIGFSVGIADLGLTPDFVDSRENLQTAHRKTCNKATELPLDKAVERLVRLGVSSPPHYLPKPVRDLWKLPAVG